MLVALGREVRDGLVLLGADEVVGADQSPRGVQADEQVVVHRLEFRQIDHLPIDRLEASLLQQLAELVSRAARLSSIRETLSASLKARVTGEVMIRYPVLIVAPYAQATSQSTKTLTFCQ